MTDFDTLVIGGGTAGMMAAYTAAATGSRVAIIEKNKRFGRKLLLTGGGRCNVTNNRPVDELITHIPGNGRFLYSTFSQWNNQDILQFFAEQGVALKEEDHGRMFPVTDRSKTIVDALVDALKKVGVTLLPNTTVEKLLIKDQLIQGVRTDRGDFSAATVIVTTGGKTYPATGSTGDGYRLAKAVGHKVTPLYPTESPLILRDAFVEAKRLQGLSLQDVSLEVVDKNDKKVTAHTMDLLFTHFGLSGPAALRCSSFVNQLLRDQTEVTLYLNCFPNLSALSLLTEIKRRLDGKKVLKNALHGLVPERLLLFFLEQLKLQDLPSNQVTKEQLTALTTLLTAFPLHCIRTFGLEKSFVTGGGVSLKEIDPKTMESKKQPGLFFAGEILDINGYTGGYNIIAAFCTGRSAGLHAAQLIEYGYMF